MKLRSLHPKRLNLNVAHIRITPTKDKGLLCLLKNVVILPLERFETSVSSSLMSVPDGYVFVVKMRWSNRILSNYIALNRIINVHINRHIREKMALHGAVFSFF